MMLHMTCTAVKTAHTVQWQVQGLLLRLVIRNICFDEQLCVSVLRGVITSLAELQQKVIMPLQGENTPLHWAAMRRLSST